MGSPWAILRVFREVKGSCSLFVEATGAERERESPVRGGEDSGEDFSEFRLPPILGYLYRLIAHPDWSIWILVFRAY